MNILVIGARGQVGSEVIKAFAATEHQLLTLTRKELDCCDLDKVIPILIILKPELIINAAAYTAVDKAEEESALAQIINASFVEQLAVYCQQTKIPLIHLSTDYVFDGAENKAYQETDLPNPQTVYGKSKWAGEQAINTHLKEHIILRVSWVFGITGSNFVKTILNLSLQREELGIVADQWGRPTAARDIARVLLELVEQLNTPSFSAWGTYHYAGEGKTNWYDFAQVFLKLAKENGNKLTLTQLNALKSEQYKTKAMRPKNSILDTAKIEKVLAIKPQRWKNYLPELIDDFFVITEKRSEIKEYKKA